MSGAISGVAGAVIGALDFIVSAITKHREFSIAEIREEIVPINDQFLSIHTNYVRLFNNLANRMRAIEGRRIEGVEDDAAIMRSLSEATSAFYVERDSMDGERDMLRLKSASLLSTTSDIDLQNYITAVCSYFINEDDHIASKEIGHINIIREKIKQGGGDKAFDTPATTLITKIKNSSDTSEILQLIETAVAGLNFKLFGVLECYYRLRIKYN